MSSDQFIASISKDEETIIAQCTPKGPGSIALLRISGVHAIEITNRMSKLPGDNHLYRQPTHTIHYGWVIDEQGNHIDQVMFLLMRAPKTFTGQDVVEITAHNNPFIIEQIIQMALAQGARLAQPGEFTRRAVANGKMDLLQAEAINELIHANTTQALKHSLAQLEGSFSHWITSLEQELIKALALSDASFEFIDEEMGFGESIKSIVQTTLGRIEIIKQTFDQQKQIRQGVRIALIGSVNAGKSSLFNALLNTNRAIVTPIAGTTRDVIEAGVYKQNSYWTLVDTAGLRTTDDTIEQEGIIRSYEQAHLADIILLVVDSSRTMNTEETEIYNDLLKKYASKIIVVLNKVDISDLQCTPQTYFERMTQALIGPAKPQESLIENEPSSAANSFVHEPTIAASCLQPESIAHLTTLLEEKIRALFSSAQAPFLLNQRQYTLLLSLEQKLTALTPMVAQEPISYELVSYHLTDAIAQLSELTGKTISENGMDAVFRQFCVGK